MLISNLQFELVVCFFFQITAYGSRRKNTSRKLGIRCALPQNIITRCNRKDLTKNIEDTHGKEHRHYLPYWYPIPASFTTSSVEGILTNDDNNGNHVKLKKPELPNFFTNGRKSITNDKLKQIQGKTDVDIERYMFGGAKYTPRTTEAVETTKLKNSWLDENLKMTRGEIDFTFIGAHKLKKY